jgi:hypothetical protein
MRTCSEQQQQQQQQKKKESIRTRFLSTLEVFAVKTRDYESCKSKKNEKDIKPHI